jgi:hypothetical protein
MSPRQFPIGWAVFVFSIIALGLVYFMYFNREVGTMQVAYTQCPSDLRMALTIRYDKPPLLNESYHMRDNDGISTYSYAVEGATGRLITITSPQREILDVSYLAGKLDQDGARSMTSEPPAGDTSTHYTLDLYRKEMYGAGDCRHESRTITFTDPHYWATTAGHQYHIDLSQGSPKNAGDLLKIQGTATADPRYQEIVDDFRTFGSDEFRARIAAAQARVRAGK